MHVKHWLNAFPKQLAQFEKQGTHFPSISSIYPSLHLRQAPALGQKMQFVSEEKESSEQRTQEPLFPRI